MAAIDKPSVTQEQDNAAEVRRLFSEGKRVTDPELVKRIRDRAEAARKAVFDRNGLLDIAVPYIRELRDGEG